ncbi:hypothetical protein PAAG_11126 [Paracoccidioides lutzii Pb01]|uniref:Uncharacterized protein n=1 Tax=Paracoccidioides lutzii (strain ATCC MYA-826 / Pb01) TaxID=502779 RepID=A0A0A2V351_PARBA|nr:hypothetical protein PAAG_11126 [Paracoccidioides lutzii Pb01]KGQ02171.1 hypothetical protein PAAG_11126 [Paracoccidioides lutzii Pb01]
MAKGDSFRRQTLDSASKDKLLEAANNRDTTMSIFQYAYFLLWLMMQTWSHVTALQSKYSPKRSWQGIGIHQ